MKKKVLLLPLLMLPLLMACNDDPVTPSSSAPISSEPAESSEESSSKAPVVYENLSFTTLYEARVNTTLESLRDKAVIMKGKIATVNADFNEFTLQNGKVAVRVTYSRIDDFTPTVGKNVEVKGKFVCGVRTLDYYLNVEGSEYMSDVIGSITEINENFNLEEVNDITEAKQVWGYTYTQNVTFSFRVTSVGNPQGITRGKWLFTGKVDDSEKEISVILQNSSQDVPEGRFHVGDSVTFRGHYFATEILVSLKNGQAYFICYDLGFLAVDK